MTISRVALVCVLGGAVFAATSSFAAPLVEESFDYGESLSSGNNIAGANGGTGFSGAWVNTKNTPDYIEPGNTAGDLLVAGGKAQGNAWSGIARPLDGSLAGANLLDDGATLWFSAILDLEGQNTSNADINIALTDAAKFHSAAFGDRENLEGATSQGIGVTHSGGFIQGVYWTDLDAGDDSVAERTESANTSVRIGATGSPPAALIVGKIVWGAAGETLSLYAPDASLNLGAPILADWVTAPLDQSDWTNLAIQFKDTSRVDEIRFGATSADVLPNVIPEPASLAMGLFGLTLIAGRRRR
jgi:hypothetical protein